MGKEIIASGQLTILHQKDAYTINQSIREFIFNANPDGSVTEKTSFTSTITVIQGDTPVTDFKIGGITVPSGFASVTVDQTKKTITYTVNANSKIANSGNIDIPIIINGVTYLHSFVWSKSIKGNTGNNGKDGNNGVDGTNGKDGNNGMDGQDGYTILSTIQNCVIPSDSAGTVAEDITLSTILSVLKGKSPLSFQIGTLPSVEGCSLSKSGNKVTLKFLKGSSLKDTGLIDIPIVVEGSTYTVSISYAKAKAGKQGNQGAQGKPGVDANLLDWVQDWNSGKTQISSDTVITPKLFAGVKNSNQTVTGTAIGRFNLTTRNDKGEFITERIDGVYGFRDGYKTFSVDNKGNVQVGRGKQSIQYDAESGKVVFGSDVSLSWTNAIDDAKEEAIKEAAEKTDAKISGLQLGARNYIPTSIFSTSLPAGFYVDGVTAVIDSTNKYDGYNSIKITQATATGTNAGTYRAYFGARKICDPASFSMWVKASASTNLRIRIGPTGTVDIPISTTWKLVKLENKAPTTNVVLFGVTTAGVTYNIAMPMLVEGTKALDWAPSPEETNASISNAISTAAKDATTKADKAKTDAISSAATDATTKSNKAKSDAISSAATDATSKADKAKSDAISSAQDKINAIQIGGVNLIPHTNRGTAGWSRTANNGTHSIQEVTALGVRAIKATTTVLADSYNVLVHTIKRSHFKNLTEYTLSMDILSEYDMDLQFSIRETNSSNVLITFGASAIKKGAWTKVTLTGKSTTNETTNQVIYITSFNKIGSVTIANLKVEEGNKATTWSAAPEDVVTDITTAKNEAINSANSNTTTQLKSLETKLNTAVSEAKKAGTDAQSTADAINKKAADQNWDKKLTFIDKDGIYTGTLSAKTVEAVKINASQITAGTINAARIDVNALKTALITAGNINALELNVVKGKIGGWSIDSDSIYRGTKNNTSGGYTSASGGVTIGSNGIRGFKWRLDATGAGALAGGNISWDASGKVTFASSVSLQWTEYADQKVNAIATGGRNYALKTSNDWTAFTTLTDKENLCVLSYKIIADQWEVGDDITVSFDYYYENIVKTGTGAARVTFQAGGDVTAWSPSMPSYAFVDKIDFVTKTGMIRVGYTFKLDASRAVNKVFNANIRHDYLTGKVRIRNLMVERANKKGDWSPAPEDIDSTIGAVKKVADDTVTALGGATYPRMTKISSTGIYTGTLTATQVNAVEINASSIKSGTLSVDRLAAGSIKAAKLDAASLKSDIINTAYINGLSCTFVRGTIGGWVISANSIRSTIGTKYFIIHSAENDSAVGGDKGHRGITIYHDDGNVADGRVKIVQMGALADRNTTQKYATETNYGFRIALKGGKDIFRVDKDGAHISNWNFDTDSIYRGTKNNTSGGLTAASGGITIGSNGIRGYRWFFDSTGNAQLGAGNELIRYNASSGKIEFGSGVTLNWLNAIDSVQIGVRNYIRKSIFTTTISGILNLDGGVTAAIDTGNKLDGYNSIKITQTTATGSNANTNRAYFNAVKVLPVASFSMWVKASAATNLRIRLGAEGAKDIPVTTSWKKIKLENIVPTTAVVLFGVTTAGVTYNIVQPMLVEGTKAVDWAYSATEIDTKFTYINDSGIYTGTLTADQVNAVSINATSIKTGTLSVDRLAAGSIKAAKLDAASIKSDIINTTYINGLSCTFVKGKIGGWTIETNRILNSNIVLDNTNRRIAVFKTGSSSTSGQRVQLFYGDDTNFGFFASDASGNEIARLGNYNKIAGWNITASQIYKNSVYLSADGSILNGSKWKLGNDGSGQLANGNIKWTTDGAVTFAESVSAAWKAGIDSASELARAMAFGRMLYRYPEFYYAGAVHRNSTKDYVCGNTTSSIFAVTGCPNSTGYAMCYVATGWNTSTDLRIGGFSWGTTSRANAIYIVRIIAHIPIGRKINIHHNSYGTGGTTKWLTPQDGTGNWAEYVCKVTCGSSGTFNTINYIALSGGVAPTSAAPVTWFIAYATVFDVTSSEKYTTSIDANGVYTGTVKANQVQVDSALVVGGSTYNGSISVRNASNSALVTLDRSGITAISGKIGGWTISSSQISAGNVIINSNGNLQNGTKWQLNNDGSGRVASGNITWTEAGAVTVTGTINASSGKIGGFDIASGRIGSTASGTGSGGGLAIYSDLFRVGSTTSYALFGHNTFPAVVGTGYCTGRLTNNVSNSYGRNYGLYCDVTGGQRNFGIYSNATISAPHFVRTRIKQLYITGDYSIDFSQHDLFIVYCNTNRAINLPTETQIRTMFGLSSLPTDFAFVFTFIYSYDWNYKLTINGLKNNNGKDATYGLERGDQITIMCAKYPSFHYQVLCFHN